MTNSYTSDFTTSTLILEPENTWEFISATPFSPQGIIEGPSLLQLTDGRYLLFYSGASADTNYYNMSGQMPKIRVETDDSSRPTVKVKNPLGVKGIDIIKDDSEVVFFINSGSSELMAIWTDSKSFVSTLKLKFRARNLRF